MQKKVKEISERLINADKILIFPHIMPDGDALGSSVALCRALRLNGKQAYVLVEDELAGNLSFLNKGDYCVFTDGSETPEEFFATIFGRGVPDVCILLDCGDYSRIEKRGEYFDAGEYTICVDHHDTSGRIAQLNWVEADRAATGEMVYLLIKEMERQTGEVLHDEEVRAAVFTAITTDTGNFQYANTTAESHRIVMEMMRDGFDHNRVSVCIYQSNRLERLIIKHMILSKMKLFADGRAAISYVTQDMLREANAAMDETEGLIDELRSIAGVEVAVFMKELPDDRIKASLRAKHYANVADIAAVYGGGGHVKASGCTFRHMDMDEAIKRISATVEEHLQEKNR